LTTIDHIWPPAKTRLLNFASGKTLDAERVVRNTPKVLKFSPKVNKIINTKKQEKL
jgi:hypothetical protein